MRNLSIFALFVGVLLLFACEEPQNVPTINDQTFNIDENIPNGTDIGTIVATDIDKGQTLQYFIISGNSTSTFVLNSASGVLSVIDNSNIDYETTSSFELVIEVKDNTELTSAGVVTINVANVNENPQIIANQSFTISENSPDGTIVGTVSASDSDSGQTLEYSIVSGNTNSAFNLDASTGIITVNDYLQLDYESTESFVLTIKVEDNEGLSSTDELTINLEDIDIPQSGLVAYYPFNDNANDESVNSNNGTVHGATFIDGRNNGNIVCKFDGVNDFVSLGDVFDDIIAGNDQQFSVAFWVKLDSDDAVSKCIMAKWADSNCSLSEREFMIKESDDNRIEFIWVTDLAGNGIRGQKSSSSISNTSDWNHVVISYDGTTDGNNGLDRVKIYFNGSEESTITTYEKNPLGDIPDGPGHFAFGGPINSSEQACGNILFNGQLDDIIIYNRKLAAEEVYTIYRE